MTGKNYKQDTELVHLGRKPEDYFGIVNPPVIRSSTIIYPSLAAFEDKGHKYRYSRMGNPLSDQFEQAMATLEGGYGAVSFPSGLSAISTSLLAFLKAGDHVLMVDTVYPPARGFCNGVLKNFGVDTEYYDPLIGSDIVNLIRDNTALIYLESPGSATLEVQDIPAIVQEAKKKNILTMIDNTWAAGVLFKPLSHGVNISIQSATKYIGGHSDINLGFAVADNHERHKKLRKTMIYSGVCAGSEDMYLALRGLRTLKMRIKKSAGHALAIVKFLQSRNEVQRIYHPALPEDPNHDLWKRDFNGSNGVFSILLKPSTKEAVTTFVESLELFPIGSSWGGYESLLQPQYPKTCRSAVPWKEEGALLRLHAGLEDPNDLIADLAQALDKFALDI